MAKLLFMTLFGALAVVAAAPGDQVGTQANLQSNRSVAIADQGGGIPPIVGPRVFVRQVGNKKNGGGPRSKTP